ncbi:MBOAT family O-acyltransferase [Lewinella sp. IMCC34191]|uniref:MBOAT family O-acyltransferase n=1 Tax=Lewinella sp. IMCC34191 TaxID=2259172 RepID=UPI000E26FB26|nr:MBOAT family O-acyltransferase [Lewinella sp. IMCC34191]
MLFNSLDFAIFLPIVFAVYWLIGRKRIESQNLLIVAASYLFYGWWDYRFLSLILFSTVVDFAIGRGLGQTDRHGTRKALLWTSILINLGFLGYFKYFNFFLDSFTDAFSFFGATIPATSLDIVLPVGISFYTFQTLSYTIDVYRRNLRPASNFVAFAAYVSFFPQLVAGPIERAVHLLPQFEKPRKFSNALASDGMRQILWGLVKKILIADNCAQFANLIFNNWDGHSGSTLFLGAIFFTFQIYGDFSGYSDIAIGTARLFGFDLMQNFNYPYFSRDIAEFWRRWHISLTTWFRDYLYIPLGGSRGTTLNKIRNTYVIFLVSGLWHGANWTFVIWGALNATFFLPLLLLGRNRKFTNSTVTGRTLPTPGECLRIIGTFLLTSLTWIFFRSENIAHAIGIFTEILSPSLFTFPEFAGKLEALTTVIIILIFMFIEWQGRIYPHPLYNLTKTTSRITRWVVYTTIVCAIYLFGYSGSSVEFIYFQF